MKIIKTAWAFLLASLQLVACGQKKSMEQSSTFKQMNTAKPTQSGQQGEAVATFGTGCFWCTEAQFQQLNGVISVESGYSGGLVENPTYKQVCTGTTGHAEVVQVHYDPSVISYDELLAAFWTAHDPTQLNRQGNDVGPQYRSVIFYHNEEQRKLATEYKSRLNAEKVFANPVVTEIAPYTAFYKAEDYHQNYYNENGQEPYCQYVIRPKLEKFRKVFADKMK